MASAVEAVDIDVGRRSSPDVEVHAEVDVADGIAGLRSRHLAAADNRMYLDQRQRWGEGAWASGVVEVPRQAWVTCCGCWYDSDCDEERSKKRSY